jgi:putative transposase
MAAVSKAGYYKWLKRKGQRPKDYENFLLVKSVFEKGRKRFGWRQVQMHLKNDHKIIMNHKKIRRIMNAYGLVCKVRRKNPYKMIMKKTQEHKTCENLLNRRFGQTVPRKVLCTDITYLYYSAGRRAFLSAVKDIASGEAMAWEISRNIEMELALNTIDKLAGLEFTADALIHSDQGTHYTNPEYQQKVKRLGFTQSMSRKGNCIDNAPMESFFGHLKDDLDIKACRTFEELVDKINGYMQYYNHKRPQWDKNKMTPAQYRDHLVAANAA